MYAKFFSIYLFIYLLSLLLFEMVNYNFSAAVASPDKISEFGFLLE